MSENNVTQQELITKAFAYLNAFKRHRALSEIKYFEGKRDESNYHKLKGYQMIDSLELALRAVQRGQRNMDEAGEGEE